MDRDALDYRPDEAMKFYLGFSLLHFFERPWLAMIKMMERSYDPGCACLLDLIQRYRVLWSKPSPSFLHRAFTSANALALCERETSHLMADDRAGFTSDLRLFRAPIPAGPYHLLALTSLRPQLAKFRL